ncbi:MAG TPA: ABC transporter ATP-binding protein [Planctomycetaceae bacterium]|nr:ABC transporter ATP-binding protein [Planctomycetaceae bacterium]
MLRDVSLSVPLGTIHSLLGPSGSGKTTLLRLIAGLETLTAGRILISGQELAAPGRHVPPERRPMGFVFQDYALFPHLSVRENVLFGMPKMKTAPRRERLDHLLRSVGMLEFAHAMPHTLSGGQQQRVALARALAREPVVMLLDEPFSGLDARLRSEIRQLTLKVLRSERVATLLVTHDPQEALLASDVISVISNGCIEQTGTPHELYFCPKTLHVAEVFGQANRFEGTVKSGRIATPWGPVEAPACDEGQRMTVLFRPESLLLNPQPSNGSTPGRVRSTCLRGETCDIEVTLPSGETVVAAAPSYAGWSPDMTAHVSVVRQSAILLPT